MCLLAFFHVLLLCLCCFCCSFVSCLLCWGFLTSVVFLFWCCVRSFVAVVVLLFRFVPPLQRECFNRCGFSHLLLLGLVFPFVVLLLFLLCVGTFCFGFLGSLEMLFFAIACSFFRAVCFCFALLFVSCAVLVCCLWLFLLLSWLWFVVFVVCVFFCAFVVPGFVFVCSFLLLFLFLFCCFCQRKTNNAMVFCTCCGFICSSAVFPKLLCSHFLCCCSFCVLSVC